MKTSANTVYTAIGGYVLYRFLFLLIVGGLLLILCRQTIEQTAITLRQHPGKSFLYGLLYYVLMPIVTILLFITVIGIPIGLLSLALYIFSFVFAKLVTLVIFSELITNTWSTWISQSWQRWGVFVLLALILAIVSGIDAIATLLAVGAIVIMLGRSLSSTKKSAEYETR